MDANKHPEGLSFPPEGAGWTEPDPVSTKFPSRGLLLTHHNIAAVERNNPVEFTELKDKLTELLPTSKDPRTGLRTKGGATEDEVTALVALTILIEKGVVQ